MALSKYTSEIKFVDHNEEVIFNFLSNFENLSQYVNESLLQKVSEQVPQIKVTDFESDNDSCRFNISGMGQAEIRIVNREPFRTIKIESSGSLPIEIIFWIQLLPVSPYQTKMKLTLHAEMGMMIKMMAGKKLKEGINQLADVLSKLPYR
ncbi:hypothetical protein [Sunxiuqinia sp. sy24]|uniref:hypothetical protein n=1 Tax=Sunxiuqinia sp. sy24 TaxID=3461495 RepID=UPI0040459DA1